MKIIEEYEIRTAKKTATKTSLKYVCPYCASKDTDTMEKTHKSMKDHCICHGCGRIFKRA
jgi:transposase-like protein